MSQEVRVTFYQVKNDQAKREIIIRLAEEYFEKKEPFLIRLPHSKALEYVDLLLWRFPRNGFLPHAVKDEPCNDLIVLTTSNENPNNARSLLNLSPEPVIKQNFSLIKIYELEDLSSTQKNQSAQIRYKAYKQSGYKIVTTSP